MFRVSNTYVQSMYRVKSVYAHVHVYKTRHTHNGHYIHEPLNFNACSCAFNESSAVNTAPPVPQGVVLGVVRSVVPPFSPFSTAPAVGGRVGAERESVVLELAWPASRARPISAVYIWGISVYVLSVRACVCGV